MVVGGLYVSLKRVGVSASRLVAASELFRRISLQPSMRLITKGIRFNSAGVAPTSKGNSGLFDL